MSHYMNNCCVITMLFTERDNEEFKGIYITKMCIEESTFYLNYY